MPQPLCFLSRVITLLTRDIHIANLSVRYVPVPVWYGKTRMVGLPDGEKKL